MWVYCPWARIRGGSSLQIVSRSSKVDVDFSPKHLLFPTIPVMQTMPCGFTHCSESSSVAVPMSSRTLSTPLPCVSCLTLAAMFPSSIITLLAPRSFNSWVRLSLRLVERTVTPWLTAIDDAARPTLVVPPRMSSVSPFLSWRALNSEPYAVWSISPQAPRTSQGKLVLSFWTCFAGTHVYSACDSVSR